MNNSRIELTITKSLEIGHIHLNTNKVIVSNPILFECKSLIHCCSNLRIPVNTWDIDRILEHGYDLGQIVDTMSPVLLPSKTAFGSTEKVYIMKKKPFVHTCTFLEDNKCSIHAFKPFACRIYPFALEVKDEFHIVVRIHTEELCEAIQQVPLEKSNNKEILENIMDLLQKELEERIN